MYHSTETTPFGTVTYNPNTGTFTNTAIPGLNTVNNITYGGITAFGNYVYLTSTATALNPTGGLIRVNINDLSSQRFASGIDFIQVAAGRDGLLYGLEGAGSPGGNVIGVYDPNSLALIRNITPAVDLRGLAVDASGNIFGIEFGGGIVELTPNGALVRTLGTPGGADIALSSTGQIVGSAGFGNVFLTDTSLNGLTANFNPGGAPLNFVAFVEPPLGVGPAATAVPEPATGLALGAGLVLLGLVRRRGRRTG